MKFAIPSLLLLAVSLSIAAGRAPLEIRAPRELETTKSKVVLRGTVAAGIDWVFCSTNRRPWDAVFLPRERAGAGRWKFTCRLRPGRNVIYFTAHYEDDLGRDRYTPYRYIIIRRVTQPIAAPTPTPEPTPMVLGAS